MKHYGKHTSAAEQVGQMCNKVGKHQNKRQ